MKSNNYNINNPLRVNEIDLLNNIVPPNINVVHCESKEEYDLINIHDPNTIYIVRVKNGNLLTYLGDNLFDVKNAVNKYYLSINNLNEYIIYMDYNVAKFSHTMQKLIPICVYDDPQHAIDALTRFNKIGSHLNINFDIYNTLKSYLNKDITTHEFITGILVIFNFREDPILQTIIESAISSNSSNTYEKFPSNFIFNISNLKNRYPNSLFRIYSDLYDLLVKYNFFKDKKYQEQFEELDVSKEINEIIDIALMRNI